MCEFHKEKVELALLTKERLTEQLEKVDTLIKTLQDECEHVDENGESSIIPVPLNFDPRLDMWHVNMCTICSEIQQRYEPITEKV